MSSMQPHAVCARFETFADQFRSALRLSGLGLLLAVSAAGCFSVVSPPGENIVGGEKLVGEDKAGAVPGVPQLLSAAVLENAVLENGSSSADQQTVNAPDTSEPFTPLTPQQALSSEFSDESMLTALLESQTDSNTQNDSNTQAAYEGAELFGISGRGEGSTREIGLAESDLGEEELEESRESASEASSVFETEFENAEQAGLDPEIKITTAEEDAEIDAVAETAITASLTEGRPTTSAVDSDVEPRGETGLGRQQQTESRAALASAPVVSSLADSSARPEPRGPIAPIRLQVAQAFFQEQTLQVKVRLTALTDLAAEEVVVGVVGLREGVEVEQHAQVLLDVIGTPQLVEEQSVLLPFTLTSTGLTEYQVRGSWGAEARKSVSGLVRTGAKQPELERGRLGQMPVETGSRNQQPGSGASSDVVGASNARAGRGIEIGRELLLDDVSIQSEELPCDESPCDQKYSINASVMNASSQTIQEVSLAIGIYWVNQGSLPKLPEPLAPASASEEVVSLGGMVLEPGVSRKVRIAVDREVPAVPGGQFVPHVRILEYRTRPRP